MKNIAKITVAALVLLSVSMESCKKGEGDPALSLRSRKARMAGEWKTISGKGSDVSGNTTSSWTYDGATYTSTSGSQSSSYGLTQEFTIDKDGTFSSTEVQTIVVGPTTITTTYASKGVWNFTSGVGEQKNKSQMVMMTDSQTTTTGSSSSTNTYTGSDRPTTLLDIYQLKNKEIIMKYKGSNTSTSGTNTSEGEYTWEAK
jgi:hypothetical protein